jgi:hypothetical protein
MDGAILDRCDFIYMMDGWEQSVGATAEMGWASKPTFTNPKELKAWLLLRGRDGQAI